MLPLQVFRVIENLGTSNTLEWGCLLLDVGEDTRGENGLLGGAVQGGMDEGIEAAGVADGLLKPEYRLFWARGILYVGISDVSQVSTRVFADRLEVHNLIEDELSLREMALREMALGKKHCHTSKTYVEFAVFVFSLPIIFPLFRKWDNGDECKAGTRDEREQVWIGERQDVMQA